MSPEYWIPMEGFEKKSGCVNRRASIFDASKKKRAKIKENAFSESYLSGDSPVFLRCLPSEVNPIPTRK